MKYWDSHVVDKSEIHAGAPHLDRNQDCSRHFHVPRTMDSGRYLAKNTFNAPVLFIMSIMFARILIMSTEHGVLHSLLSCVEWIGMPETPKFRSGE